MYRENAWSKSNEIKIEFVNVKWKINFSYIINSWNKRKSRSR